MMKIVEQFDEDSLERRVFLISRYLSGMVKPFLSSSQAIELIFQPQCVQMNFIVFMPIVSNASSDNTPIFDTG